MLTGVVRHNRGDVWTVEYSYPLTLFDLHTTETFPPAPVTLAGTLEEIAA